MLVRSFDYAKPCAVAAGGAEHAESISHPDSKIGCGCRSVILCHGIVFVVAKGVTGYDVVSDNVDHVFDSLVDGGDSVELVRRRDFSSSSAY